jgi:hypothetical protein
MEAVEHKQLGCSHEAYEIGRFKKEGQATMKKKSNLHQPHLALAPSNAAFISTHPECG